METPWPAPPAGADVALQPHTWPIYLDHVLYPTLSPDAFVTEIHHAPRVSRALSGALGTGTTRRPTPARQGPAAKGPAAEGSPQQPQCVCQ